MKNGGLRILEGGAVGSAIATSICCFGPLILATLGLGGGALLLGFEPYRPVFGILTVLFLGASFYLAYRKADTEECQPGSTCARSEKASRVGLWIATALVALLTALSYLAERLS